MKKIAMLGCFDTKAEDFSYLYQCLAACELEVMAINLGIKGSTDLFPVTVEAEQLAAKNGVDIEQLRKLNDRNSALDLMGAAAAAFLADCYEKGQLDG